MHVVAERPERFTQFLQQVAARRHLGAQEVGHLFDEHREGTDDAGKAQHLEDQRATRVVQAAAFADLAEWLARWAAVQQPNLSGLQLQHVQEPLWINHAHIRLPNDLAGRVATQGGGAVGVAFDGTDGLEPSLLHADVHPAGAGEQTDCRAIPLSHRTARVAWARILPLARVLDDADDAIAPRLGQHDGGGRRGAPYPKRARPQHRLGTGGRAAESPQASPH